MTQIGPATGNFSRDSIRSAKRDVRNKPKPERLVDDPYALGGHRNTYNPFVLTQRYGNDYQAEINRRNAIDPNDPTIAVLTDLRNKKLNGQQTGSDYGTGSTDYGTGSYNTGLNDTNALIDNYADSQTNNLMQSLRSAFDQQRTDLYAQKPMIQQEAQEMRNSADTNFYTNDLQNLYKAMEAGGQKGGENITGMVSANATRGQGHNNANLYESNQLRNIDNAVSNLGAQQAQSEADALAGINTDTFNARLQAMRDAVSQYQTNQANEKSDYLNTIGAYSDNYMQEINNLRTQGVPDTDYRIRVLLAARNQKISNQQAAAAEAAQQDTENAMRWAQINYDINKPYYKPSSGGSNLSYSEALTRYNAGDRSAEVLSALGL